MRPLLSLLLALSVVTGAIICTPPSEACQPDPDRWYPEAPSVTEIPADGALPIVFDGRGVRLDDPENAGVTIRVQNQQGVGVNGTFRAYELPSTQTNVFGYTYWRRLVAWRPKNGWNAGESYTLTRVEESTSRRTYRTDFSHTFTVVDASAGEPSLPIVTDTNLSVREEIADQECCVIPGCQTDCPPAGECTECWTTRYGYRALLAANVEPLVDPHPSQWLVGFEGAEDMRRASDVDPVTITRTFIAGAEPYCASLFTLRIADGVKSEAVEVCESELPDFETRGGSERPAVCDRDVGDDSGMDAGYEDVPRHPPGDDGENTSVGSRDASDIGDRDDADRPGASDPTGGNRGCAQAPGSDNAMPVALIFLLFWTAARFRRNSRSRRPPSID